MRVARDRPVSRVRKNAGWIECVRIPCRIKIWRRVPGPHGVGKTREIVYHIDVVPPDLLHPKTLAASDTAGDKETTTPNQVYIMHGARLIIVYPGIHTDNKRTTDRYSVY